jgi:hypothetical protein
MTRAHTGVSYDISIPDSLPSIILMYVILTSYLSDPAPKHTPRSSAAASHVVTGVKEGELALHVDAMSLTLPIFTSLVLPTATPVSLLLLQECADWAADAPSHPRCSPHIPALPKVTLHPPPLLHRLRHPHSAPRPAPFRPCHPSTLAHPLVHTAPVMSRATPLHETEHVSIIGQGNVVLDIACMLLTPPAAALSTATRRNLPIEDAWEQDEIEAKSNRVFKKRQTSFDAPELHNEEEEVEVEDQVQRRGSKSTFTTSSMVEADPDGAEWEDLDAEDADNPMMVSEYINDIFEYLKVVKVRSLVLP